MILLHPSAPHLDLHAAATAAGIHQGLALPVQPALCSPRSSASLCRALLPERAERDTTTRDIYNYLVVQVGQVQLPGGRAGEVQQNGVRAGEVRQNGGRAGEIGQFGGAGEGILCPPPTRGTVLPPPTAFHPASLVILHCRPTSRCPSATCTVSWPTPSAWSVPRR